METLNKILWKSTITIIWLISSFMTIIMFIHYGYNIKYEDILTLLSKFDLNFECFSTYILYLVEFVIATKILK